MKIGNWRLVVIWVLCLAAYSSGYGQDPQYTQFYANQPMLNPAFTGAAIGPRVSMNYRAQWVAIQGSFRQFAVGYDQPVYFGRNADRSINGLGVLVQNDVAGEGNLSKLSVNINYAFGIEFGRRGHEQYLRFGLTGGFEQASINLYKLRFGDQIDLRDGFIYATNEIQPPSRLNPDVGAGIAYYNKYAWAALSVHHLTEPEQELLPAGTGVQDSRLPRRYTATAGLRLPVGPMNDPESVTISPAILFMKQRNFNQLNFGTYVNIDPMVFGLWWRTNYNNFNGDFISSDAVAGLLGFKQGIFSIGYSYDYTISRLTNGISGGSHEIAIVMEFERNRVKSFKHRSLPCPRF